jgi:hypothetical protein
MMLTPLPGCEDHKIFWQQGIDMDPDLNKYDLEHAVTDHRSMTRAEWQAIYNEAWSRYYSRDHVEVLLRRAAAKAIPLASLIKVLVPFMTMVRLEGVHPLQAGLFRLKRRKERRPDLPRESLWSYYPRAIQNFVRKNLELAKTIWWLLAIKRRIERDPARRDYTDVSLTPVRDDEQDTTLDLLTKTAGVRDALAHQKRVEELTRG